jgi:hypothetical protein
MRSFFVLTAAALAIIPASVVGSTLFTENFNELTPMLNATSVGGFSTTGGTNVDIVGGSVFGSLCVAPEAINCVDMDGSNGNTQGVLQTNATFTLMPGINYFLSFDLIGSQRGNTASTTVTFASYNQEFTLASADVTDGIVTNALITVTTPTVTSLVFTSDTPGAIGDLLDNVSITSTPQSTVPEPSSAMLVGFALILAAWAMRSRRSLALVAKR